jgi:hypothetical protein
MPQITLIDKKSGGVCAAQVLKKGVWDYAVSNKVYYWLGLFED